ncbi:MAG: DUF512 domain-containing protein [Clostridia bacterium]|nr:DUF512 domain-containing protein [Clostridia bacterium]
MKHKIKEIVHGSIAEEMQIESGDYLVSINGEEIKDILDYKFQIFDEYITVVIEKANGEEWELEIEKEENEDLGIVFPEQLIEKPRNCANKCIFCFMDQLPDKVRQTLIFKDDDFRLSFITGNYVTLTNSGYKDLDRIIKYHLSPINISVHATDPDVRKMMLNNKNADKIMEYIKYLTDHDIKVNAQIVLCPGINDGKILDKTIAELSEYAPTLQCIAIVPVGLTKYRKNLYPLKVFDEEGCRKTIAQVNKWQTRFKKKYGINLVYLADEFYMKAKRKVPDFKEYDEFPQLEDGIGMLAYFDKEFETYLRRFKGRKLEKTVSIATGKIAYGFIRSKMDELEKKFTGLKVNVYPIENLFFGTEITVTGLITGNDLITGLQDKELGEYLIICEDMLKSDENVFLDDVTLSEVKEKLNTNIVVSGRGGKSNIRAVIYGESCKNG